MYDFEMSVGDFFEGHCLVEGPQYISLSDINEEYLFNENRLLYQLVTGYPCCDWGYQLEGIGNYFPGGGAAYFSLFTHIFVPMGCPCTTLIRYCIGTNEECLYGFVVVGSDEYNLQNEITIYPNPVIKTLSIDNNSDIKIEIIQLYDVLGKLVLEEKNNFQEIDITLLQNSIYLVNITTDHGRLMKKILKL